MERVVPADYGSDDAQGLVPHARDLVREHKVRRARLVFQPTLAILNRPGELGQGREDLAERGVDGCGMGSGLEVSVAVPRLRGAECELSGSTIGRTLRRIRPSSLHRVPAPLRTRFPHLSQGNLNSPVFPVSRLARPTMAFCSLTTHSLKLRRTLLRSLQLVRAHAT